MKIETQEIRLDLLKKKEIRLFIKRIDQTHASISGNKWYKLKYNLIQAREKGCKTILTFGGAYSNHIYATACIAKEYGFNSIGVIRGEECLSLNPTLNFASQNGMRLHYISRSDYQLKDTNRFMHYLKSRFVDFYLLPEGGTNNLAIKGAEEILSSNDVCDIICVAVGTGGTISGIINKTRPLQQVIGFLSFKDFRIVQENISAWTKKRNWKLINNYSFGGYAKINNELVNFINQFYSAQIIPLDAVYTGKMMFGILDLVEQDYFKRGSRILAIHTGGLQGNIGMNERFGLNLPIQT